MKLSIIFNNGIKIYFIDPEIIKFILDWYHWKENLIKEQKIAVSIEDGYIILNRDNISHVIYKNPNK